MGIVVGRMLFLLPSSFRKQHDRYGKSTLRMLTAVISQYIPYVYFL